MLTIGFVAAAVFAAARLVDLNSRGLVLEAAEGLAAPAYIAICFALCCAFLPTPALAAAAGVLFGVVLGAPLALATFTLSACAQVSAGRAGFGPRLDAESSRLQARLNTLTRESGWQAIATLRLFPGIPFALSNYAAGLTPVAIRSVAVGTAIGAAPRTVIYAGFGDVLTKLEGESLVVALSLLALVGLLGLGLAYMLWRRTQIL